MLQQVLGWIGILTFFGLLAALAAFFARLERSSDKQKPRQEGAVLEFCLATRMRFLLRSVLVALGVFTVLVLTVAVSRGEGWYGALAPLSVVVAILLAKPRTVLLDHNGIRQKRWIRGAREIAWNEIAWMRRGRNTGTTYVKSMNGGRAHFFLPPPSGPVPV